MTTKEMKSLDFGNGVVYEIVDETARDNVTTQTFVTLNSGTISLNKITPIYKHTVASAVTYTFDTSSLNIANNQIYTFELYVIMSSVSTLTFPQNVSWQGGEEPDMSDTGVYFFAFRTLDGGLNWIGNLQGVWS